MTRDEKLERLEKMFNSFGLSMKDPEVKEYLLEEKQISALDEDLRFSYCYVSHLIKPTKIKILPNNIENASYRKEDWISNKLNWYLDAFESNPLVYNNLNAEMESFKKGFENRTFALEVSPNGKIFNTMDGNHRLLLLSLRHFAEKLSAKTMNEKLEVDKKYLMEVPVSYPISMELADLLFLENKKFQASLQDNQNTIEARYYHQKVFSKSSQKRHYLATFDPETKIFNYSLDDDKFQGNESELINFLKTKKKTNENILTYSCDDVYYVSCNNFVWRTKNKELASKIAKNATENYSKASKRKFLSVRDYDNPKTGFSIKTPEYLLDSWIEEEKKKIEEILPALINVSNSNELNFLTNEQLETIKNNCTEDGIISQGGHLIIPEMEFENLTKEEYLKISSSLSKIDELFFPQTKEKDLDM